MLFTIFTWSLKCYMNENTEGVKIISMCPQEEGKCDPKQQELDSV